MPTFAEALSNVGTGFKEMGKHEEAALAFQRAIAVKPVLCEVSGALTMHCPHCESPPSPPSPPTRAETSLSMWSRSHADRAEIAPRSRCVAGGAAQAYKNLGSSYGEIDGRLPEAVGWHRLEHMPSTALEHTPSRRMTASNESSSSDVMHARVCVCVCACVCLCVRVCVCAGRRF